MMYPPSYAMDATASGGGPSTVLPQIVTGSPEAIGSHVNELLQKAQQFLSLIEEFRKAEQQLQQVWSGHAADSAVKKIEDSLKSFTDIVNVINRGAQLLQQSATLVKTAQTGYTSVVGAVNPTVAGLMSNPYTYSAAVALSTSTSAALKGFIQAVSGLLKTLGAVNLASELNSVVQIISTLEQLFNNKGTGASGGTTPTTGTTGAAVTAPQAPGSVGNPAVLTSAGTAAAAAPTAPTSTAPTSLQTGEQGLLHTPDGRLYTADGQPLLTANGSPAYQNYQPAALNGLPNSAGAPTPSVPSIPISSVPSIPTSSVPSIATSSVPSASVPAVDTAGLAAAGTSGLHLPGPSQTGATAGVPGASSTDSWLAVDPSQHAAGVVDPTAAGATPVDTSAMSAGAAPVGSAPADAAGVGHAGAGEEITVTTTHNGTTTTVEVPMDAHETVTVDAEGTVKVG